MKKNNALENISPKGLLCRDRDHGFVEDTRSGNRPVVRYLLFPPYVSMYLYITLEDASGDFLHGARVIPRNYDSAPRLREAVRTANREAYCGGETEQAV